MLLKFVLRPVSCSLRFYGKAMESFKTVGTHDGVFHCDEVLGCYMIRLLNPNLSVVRSRDEKILGECDIVIDVGSVYDPSKHRYDHHQRGFAESMSTLVPGKPWTTKLSSAGLVYCHFGKLIIKKIVNVDDDAIEPIYDRMYENFIREIDGIDNGIPLSDGELNYRISTNLSARVGAFNRNWNQTEFDETEAFNKALEYAGKEFEDRVKYAAMVWWPARKIVRDAVENRYGVHPSGEIMQLEKFCPWEEHFFQIEKELRLEEPLVKYLLFQDTKGSWRVRAVPVEKGSFVLRLPLHEPWRGLRNEGDSHELLKTSGIEGCIFVHVSGFIGGNKTRDGALEMAVKSIELDKKTV